MPTMRAISFLWVSLWSKAKNCGLCSESSCLYIYNTKIINLRESSKGTPLFCIAGIALRGYAPGRKANPRCFSFYSKSRNTNIDMQDIPIKKKGMKNKEHMLGEVVVKSTKIKMIMKGDTIVYNADAFNLPEGSMLDALIRQLPGATLNSNGEIFINGRKLDYLTLNGKDFFKGNNKQLIENLPNYTVKNLKVFEKSTDRSQAMGVDIDKKDYIMDILHLVIHSQLLPMLMHIKS